MNDRAVDPLLGTLVLALAGGLGALAVSGCQESVKGCSSDRECRGSRVCVRGQCRFSTEDSSPGAPDAASDASTDVERPDADRPDTSDPADGGPSRDATDPPVDAQSDTPPSSVDAQSDTSPSDTGADAAPDTAPDVAPDTAPDTRPSGPREIELVPPNAIDFGSVPVNSTSTQTLVIKNVGGKDLKVTDVGLETTPSTGFAVSGPSTDLTIPPGQSETYTVEFNPPRSAPRYRNSVVVESNDADESTLKVDLEGGADNRRSGACLYNTPDSLDFGVVQPGNQQTEKITLGNCSTSTKTTVTVITFASNQKNSFELGPAARQPPYRLDPGKTEQLPVVFEPTSRADVTGELVVRSDEQGSSREVIDLAGSGGGCPQAETTASLASPDDVSRDGPIPAVAGRNEVELDGSASTAPSGNVQYDWNLQTPTGSSASLNNAGGPDPTFKPDKKGVYTVDLSVDDASTGAQGCTDDTVEVVAKSSRFALEIESQWEGDHDLDLHVVRSDGQGNFPSFGDPDADVTADNQRQNWGQKSSKFDDAYHFGDIGPAETPDDFNGGETVWLGELEQGRSYRIAVHLSDNEGRQPFRFPVSASLRIEQSSGAPKTETLQNSLNLIQNFGDYWITWEIETSPLKINEIDREQ